MHVMHSISDASTDWVRSFHKELVKIQTDLAAYQDDDNPFQQVALLVLYQLQKVPVHT